MDYEFFLKNYDLEINSVGEKKKKAHELRGLLFITRVFDPNASLSLFYEMALYLSR